MNCPRCKRTTRPNQAMRRNGRFRDWQGDESLPCAYKSDGTCTRCHEQVRRVVGRFGLDYVPTEAEIIERGKREIAAYFADRRARGVNPAGSKILDKAFEDDCKTGAWQLPRNLARRSHAKQREQLGLPTQRGA